MTGIQGDDQPATDIVEEDQHSLGTSDATLILSEECASVAIVADPGNNDVIFVGGTDSVSSTTGVPLDAGAAISLDINANEQPFWAIALSSGDRVSVISTN